MSNPVFAYKKMISKTLQAIGERYAQYLAALQEAEGLLQQETPDAVQSERLNGLVRRLQSDTRSPELLLPEQKSRLEALLAAQKKRTAQTNLFRRERTSAVLENLEGNLKDAYVLAEPGTVLHADELMNEQRTNDSLCGVPFYTADGNLYFIRDGKPFWAITREPENLVLRHLDAAFPQLIQSNNYYPDPAEAAEALVADDTILIDVSQLGLGGTGNEGCYLAINTAPEGYPQLNAEGRKAAERVFGSGEDFVQNMQMLRDARIRETKIYLLNPAYIARHASQRILGRGSWLGSFSFIGVDRDIGDLARLRGVRRSRR